MTTGIICPRCRRVPVAAMDGHGVYTWSVRCDGASDGHGVAVFGRTEAEAWARFAQIPDPRRSGEATA